MIVLQMLATIILSFIALMSFICILAPIFGEVTLNGYNASGFQKFLVFIGGSITFTICTYIITQVWN